MKRTTTFSNLGGLQSIFFCAGIYAVSLFFSIFICSSVFYAFNPKKANSNQHISQVSAPAEKAMFASVGK
ncbi:MAG: hypothetical protein ABIQ88_14895 [Chitinophagaceae bacterium]